MIKMDPIYVVTNNAAVYENMSTSLNENLLYLPSSSKGSVPLY
jgi:hypothetical protein